MKQIAEIRMGQRVAGGNISNKETRIYVYTFAGAQTPDDVRFTCKEYETYGATRVFGYYTISHPCFLVGSWEENLMEFIQACASHLKQNLLPGMYISVSNFICCRLTE